MKNENESIIKRISEKLRSKKNDDFYSDYEEETTKNEASSAEQFIDSLNSISADDIAPPKSRGTVFKKRLGKLIRTALLVVCITIFCYCLYMISYELISGITAKKEYLEIENDFFEGIDLSLNGDINTLKPPKTSPETPIYGKERPEYNPNSFEIIDSQSDVFTQIREKLTLYKEENSDTYAWIRIGGTNISYIVVKGTDNDYYLEHTYKKRYNALGTIFADYQCRENILENPNIVLYGHNASYQGQMFSDLTKYLSESFFNENRYITLYTEEGILTYEIFSIHEANYMYHYFKTLFYSEDEFLSWAEEMKNNSIHGPDEELTFSNTDRILTLSTCTNGLDTQRYAVHAKLVSIER